MNKPMRETPLQEAVRLAGGPAALARALGKTPQIVWNWMNRPPQPEREDAAAKTKKAAKGRKPAKVVERVPEAPASECVAIERLTGVSRRRLRASDWQKYWPELEDQEAQAA